MGLIYVHFAIFMHYQKSRTSPLRMRKTSELVGGISIADCMQIPLEFVRLTRMSFPIAQHGPCISISYFGQIGFTFSFSIVSYIKSNPRNMSSISLGETAHEAEFTMHSGGRSALDFNYSRLAAQMAAPFCTSKKGRLTL